MKLPVFGLVYKSYVLIFKEFVQILLIVLFYTVFAILYASILFGALAALVSADYVKYLDVNYYNKMEIALFLAVAHIVFLMAAVGVSWSKFLIVRKKESSLFAGLRLRSMKMFVYLLTLMIAYAIIFYLFDLLLDEIDKSKDQYLYYGVSFSKYLIPTLLIGYVYIRFFPGLAACSLGGGIAGGWNVSRGNAFRILVALMVVNLFPVLAFLGVLFFPFLNETKQLVLQIGIDESYQGYVLTIVDLIYFGYPLFFGVFATYALAAVCYIRFQEASGVDQDEFLKFFNQTPAIFGKPRGPVFNRQVYEKH